MEKIAEFEKKGLYIFITAGDGYKGWLTVEAEGKLKDLDGFAGYHVPNEIYERYKDTYGLIVITFRYNETYERFEVTESLYILDEKSHEWKEYDPAFEMWVNEEVIWPLSLLLMELL